MPTKTKKIPKPEGQSSIAHLLKPVGPVKYALQDFDFQNTEIDWSKIGIIIPAYNEEQTVARIVIAAKVVHPGRLIVVANNSTDNTAQVAEEAGAEVYNCPIKGKAEAMLTGVNKLDESETPIVMFLDADLTNFKTDHIKALASPFFREDGELPNIMTLGTFDRGEKQNEFYWFNLPFLAGQRALLVKEFKQALKGTHATGWEIEATLNAYFRDEKLRFVPMVLDNVYHIPKDQKFQETRGQWERVKMLFIAMMGYIKFPFRKFWYTVTRKT